MSSARVIVIVRADSLSEPAPKEAHMKEARDVSAVAVSS